MASLSNDTDLVTEWIKRAEERKKRSDNRIDFISTLISHHKAKISNLEQEIASAQEAAGQIDRDAGVAQQMKQLLQTTQSTHVDVQSAVEDSPGASNPPSTDSATIDRMTVGFIRPRKHKMDEDEHYRRVKNEQDQSIGEQDEQDEDFCEQERSILELQGYKLL